MRSSPQAEPCGHGCQSHGERHGAQRTADLDTPLLYVLRNDLGLNATKFGCGLGQCGACTVLIDGAASRSCVMPIGALTQSEIITLEGLGTLEQPHPPAVCFHGGAGGAVRLLHRRHDHDGQSGFSTANRARARPTCDSDSSAISAVAGPITGSSARFSKRRRRWGEVNEDEPGRSCVPRPSAASLLLALC